MKYCVMFKYDPPNLEGRSTITDYNAASDAIEEIIEIVYKNAKKKLL